MRSAASSSRMPDAIVTAKCCSFTPQLERLSLVDTTNSQHRLQESANHQPVGNSCSGHLLGAVRDRY
jgi:hypothetical protein